LRDYIRVTLLAIEHKGIMAAFYSTGLESQKMEEIH